MPADNTSRAAADNTASAQLERVLYILAAAAREDGAALDELATALGVDPDIVLRDIEYVTARAFYHPAGAVDSFSIFIDGRSVEVHAPQEFNRPVRLSSREALALELGLRAIAADADIERKREILDLARRLEAELRAPDIETTHEIRQATSVRHTSLDDPTPMLSDADAVDAVEEYAIAFDDDGFRGVVADAIDVGCLCTIWYLKPGDVAPAYRTIAPYHLVHAHGRWYVAAYDIDREALRFFRMDRVLNAELEDESVPPLPQQDLQSLLDGGGPFMAGDDIEVSVRYSPRVARWVQEHIDSPAEHDGSVVVRHRVADPRWIVRHVLQYGGEAVVEAPTEARTWVAAAANGVTDPND